MILLSSKDLDAIISQAQQCYPEEACGFLIGSDCRNGDLQVSSVVASDNVTVLDRTKNFEIDPELRLKLMVELRESSSKTSLQSNQRIIGHYHSHPNGLSAPSERDLDMAWEPDLVWLILAVSNGEVDEFKSYKLSSHTHKFREVDIEVRISENII